MSKFCAVEIEGKVTIHLPNPAHAGGWFTLCGLDGDDPSHGIEQKTVDVPKGARVDCRECYQIWKLAQEFERVDFEMELLKWSS